MLLKVFFNVVVIHSIFTNNIHAQLMHVDLESDQYPFDRQLYKDVLDPALCRRQLTYLTTDTGLLARFLDAGLRLPKGILEGNVWDFGSFHQCLAINEQAEDMSISGKHCRIEVPMQQDFQLPGLLDTSLVKFDPRTLKIDKYTLKKLQVVNNQNGGLKSSIFEPDARLGPDSPLTNVSFHLSICIPRPCTIEQAVNGLLFNLTDAGFEFNEGSCRLPDDRPWAAVDYVATVVFSIIGFLTVVSTCYDLHQSLYLKKGAKEISLMYTSFSVYTNARRLVTFKTSPGSLECLDGIRALAIIWVILGHSFHTVSITLNPGDTFLWSISPQGAWITVAPLTVDTFFFLSGLLLVYTVIGKVGRMELLKNLHVFYLHRLLRMFPILAAVVLFEASFFMRVADGPIWDRVVAPVLRCRQFWWSTLLHLQNIVNPREACIGVTWYLAIDVQLHILSPIVLFWVLTSNRAAWAALNASLVAVLTASTIFIFFKNFPSGIVSPNRSDEGPYFYINYYVNILTRTSPFIVGMIYGYIIHLRRKNNVKVPQILSTVLLLGSMVTVLVVMYCAHIAMRLDWDNQVADNFFNSFLRPLWALAVGWMVFSCVDGKAGPLNWFLSLHMWKLPARISYAMYLVHYSIMVAFNASIITPIYFTVPSILFNFMAYLLITMILSFFVTMVIDMPFARIFSHVLKGGAKKTQKSEVKTAEIDATKHRNERDYNFAADENENDKKQYQPSNIISENGEIKLNLKKK